MKYLGKILWVVAGGVLGLALSVVLGDRIAVKLSSLPLVRQYRIVATQAPIVIHTTEEVRSRGDEDAVAALEKARNVVSGILQIKDGRLQMVGSAVNLASDGVFVATVKLKDTDKDIYISLSDGTLRTVSKIVHDPASGLVFLTARGGGSVAVATISTDPVRPAQRVLLLSAGQNKDALQAGLSFVRSSPLFRDDAEAGYFNVNFQLANNDFAAGDFAVVNMTGEVVGVALDGRVLPATLVDSIAKNYLSGQNFVRPNFGFAFHFVSAAEAAVLPAPANSLLVLRVAAGSPAAASGLKAGDFVNLSG